MSAPIPIPGAPARVLTAPARCAWAGSGDPLMVAYHDEEWGVPSHDDRHLFEMLVLEGAQAGLSWSTVLHRREGYRRAFAQFDAVRVAGFGARDRARLMADTGIIRNGAKIDAAIATAGAVLRAREAHGSLAAFLWSLAGGAPVQNGWRTPAEVPAETEVSRRMSRELRRAGFRFVGPVVCYAFMQAVGMVNDHATTCFRHAEVAA
jgi:DNA-3-methyladenine glycosylase I